jgi:hypothetical protein
MAELLMGDRASDELGWTTLLGAARGGPDVSRKAAVAARGEWLRRLLVD